MWRGYISRCSFSFLLLIWTLLLIREKLVSFQFFPFTIPDCKFRRNLFLNYFRNNGFKISEVFIQVALYNCNFGREGFQFIYNFVKVGIIVIIINFFLITADLKWSLIKGYRPFFVSTVTLLLSFSPLPAILKIGLFHDWVMYGNAD